MAQVINLGDALEGLRSQPNESLDCVVTSPPYKDVDGFDYEAQLNIFTECVRAMKKGALCFVNFGHLAEEKSRPFRLATLLEDNVRDLHLQETFVWVKNHYRPIQGKRRVNNLSEFIFMFSKGPMPELDRLAVGIPYADKSNVGRFADSDLKCGGNVWHIPYDTIQSSKDKLHNDRFPLELPTKCLLLAGAKPGWLVCDPFSGSGTTAVACRNLDLDFVGWEINLEHFETATRRINGICNS